MNDCRKKAESDMTNNRTLLDEFIEHLDQAAGPMPDSVRNEAPDKVRMDLDYLTTERNTLGRKIEKLQAEVRISRDQNSPC